MFDKVAFTVLLSVASSAALAQAVPPAADATAASPTPVVAVAPQPVAVVQTPKSENILRAGAEVPLIMREELTTKKKKLRVGQRFQMEVASSVSANGVVVIPGGTPAVGEITEVRNKGMWGKSGYIGARVISMRLGDRSVRLTGSFDDKGVTGTGGVVAAVVFIPIAGFFTTGTSAVIPMGGAVKAFLDEDLAFDVSNAKP